MNVDDRDAGSSLSNFRGSWHQQFSRPQRNLIWRVVSDQIDPYTDFHKPKSDGGRRPISAPVAEWMGILKVLQYRYLASPGIASDSAFAYVSGRSPADCARRHLDSEWIIRVDIQDFFHSISEDRIYMSLKESELDSDSARVLSRMTTRRPADPIPEWLRPFGAGTRKLPGMRDTTAKIGFLPQGSPTSGALSNLVTRRLDELLSAAAQGQGWRYSRYADDIFMSAPKATGPTNGPTIRRAIDEAVAIVHQAVIVEGFNPNAKKTRVMRQGNRHIILGILVDGLTLRPTRDKVTHVKFHLHALAKNRYWNDHAKRHGFESEEALINHIGGYLSYFADINKDFAAPLLDRWLKIMTARQRPLPLLTLPLTQKSPKQDLADILAEGDKFVRTLVAKNPNTPENLLKQLALDANEFVRIGVAKNANTPESLLKQLALDANEFVRMEVAKNQLAPRALLQKMAKDSSELVRREVAANTHTPVSVLGALAGDESEPVRIALASNPKTAPQILEVLASGATETVLSHLVTNPRTTTRTLETIAKDAGQVFSEELARHQNTPIALLEQLAGAKVAEVRLLVSRHRGVTPHILEQLAHDSDLEVLVSVAGNPDTPATALTVLSKNEDYYIRQLVAENPSTPPKLLKLLSEDDGTAIRQNVALNPNTPAQTRQELIKDPVIRAVVLLETGNEQSREALLELCAHPDSEVRETLAWHLGTPEDVMDKLADDEDTGVRAFLAENPAAPESVLKRLSQDPNPSVRRSLLDNPEVPTEILLQLLSDEEPGIRELAARHSKAPDADPRDAGNPATPVATLRKLAKEIATPIRAKVAENPTTPVDLLAELSTDIYPRVRRAVAENPNTPPELLAVLATDFQLPVRRGVAKNPNTPTEILQKLADNNS